MAPAEYNAWYDSPRGRWIGEREYTLARELLAPKAGDSLLDVGCGTGWFTRHFALDGCKVTGVDIDTAAIGFARQCSGSNVIYQEGDARKLPFADNSFERVASIAALCFVDDERQAVAEIVRVARKRFVIGWLNRNSLLYLSHGRKGGTGGYRGARWHDTSEIRQLLSGLPVNNIRVVSVVYFPQATGFSRVMEHWVPGTLPLGSLLLIAGDKSEK